MSKIFSIILYCIICMAGIAVAILSANQSGVVMCLGIIIALFTLIVGLLTTRDIDQLQMKANNAVYMGECLGVVPSIDSEVIKENIKKAYPDLNS